MLKRFLFKIQYKGSNYHGWQLQNDQPTIQLSFNKAIFQILKYKASFTACSRTDAGVHALDQIISTLLPAETSTQTLLKGLNAVLPKDIRVLKVASCEDHYDPRKVNDGKLYRYDIWNAPFDSVMDFEVHWWVRNKLLLEVMKEACSILEGKHDFKAFRGKNCQQEKTVKQIYSVWIETKHSEHGDFVRIYFRGNSFLKNMVRIMTGTIVDIGRGKLPIETLRRPFDHLSRSDLGITAPAQGLFLEKIYLDPDPFKVI